MRNRQIIEKLHPLSVFVLIAAFFVLSNCPLRNTLQDMLKGTHTSGHASTRHDNKFTTVGCLAVINSSTAKLILPEVQFNISAPAFGALMLILFYPLWGRVVIDKELIAYTPVHLSSPIPVPLYIKNRIILI